MVPIMSSSSGKGDCEALPEFLAEAELAGSIQSNDSRLCEGSDATSSPQSFGLSATSESDGVSTSSQEQASPPLRHELFQTIPTTPFRFPSSRRDSSCDSSTGPVQQPPQQQQQQQPQTTVEPTSHSGGFFGYCFDRGNGLYTRLVPADQLPPSAGYSALQSGCNGMIVLQDPLSQGVPGNEFDPVLQPKTRAYASARADAFMQRPGQGSVNVHFNSKIAKRNKVYCDKWVHEGICAFTQQGCKFKHEMPHDRSVQRSLGLFHGYPNWYKRQHMQHQRAINMDAASRFPQALPELSVRQRHAFSFDPHSTHFAPKSASIRLDSYPLSVPTVPPAPPTTPLSLPQRTELYLPSVAGCSDSPAIDRSHLRGSSRSSSSTDSLCRTSGVHVPLWRPSQRGAKMKNLYLDEDSDGYLAERFVRSLTIGELPKSRFGQSQSQQQQQPQAPQLRTPYPADSFSEWDRYRGCLGSLAAMDSKPPDYLLGKIGEHGSFGPIGPPTRDLSDEIPLPTSYAFNESRNLSHGVHPEEDGTAFD
ncbi:hypothetical protein SEPCBS57363_003566 [Sporothrix epigloea]|uniref:C3H1-type domain-containing protein n=1 Tax=Sporothrix epigloea TaxID=1892477 RepID=A0ABP0DM62_9PEZI